MTPSYQGNLRHFCDANIIAPLNWLGLGVDYMEVTSMESSNFGIRLIHKIQDIPVEKPTQERLFDTGSSGKGFGKRK